MFFGDGGLLKRFQVPFTTLQRHLDEMEEGSDGRFGLQGKHIKLCEAIRKKKLLVTSATLVVTGAVLVETRSY